MTKGTAFLFVAAITIGLSNGARAQTPEAGGAGQHEQMMKGMMGMTDAMFVPMMIKHHQHGIEMARVEEERGSAAPVKALATKIRRSQEKELAELKAHARKGMSGHVEHDKMMERQGQSMMAKLKSTSGAALDHAFLELMARHHEGAIAMTESAKLKDPDLKKLAQEMVTGQQRELAELRTHLSVHAPK